MLGIVVGIVATGAACGDSGPTGEAEVEIGTGTTEFEPLEAEQDLPLVAGPQGGFHFIINARARGIDLGEPLMPGAPSNPLTAFLVYREDGERIDIGAPPYRLGYRETADGWGQLTGRILRIENPEVPAIYGQRVRVRVQLETADGDRALDERWVVVTEGEDLTIPDAGVPDAGVADAGPLDAGVDAPLADAAAPDAGEPPPADLR